MIGVALDLLLIVLLGGALLLGMRLEKKLRYLRETQAGFAGAAAELNMALARAEGGLQEMKTTAAEAQLVLGDRLQDARALNARLEQRMIAADKAAAALETRMAAAERATAGLDAMIRRAGETERGAALSSPVQRKRTAEAPEPSGPVRPSATPAPHAREEKDGEQRVGHLQMLRREAIARRQGAPAAELVLDAPLRPEALSRRPARFEDELFEPVRKAAGGRR
jgi:hypothetical protein